MTQRAALIGSVLFGTAVLAAVASPATAVVHHQTTAKKGVVIASVKATATTSAGVVSLGRVLASTKGRVIYLFTEDKGKTSRCSGACASAWPKVTSKVKPAAAKRVLAKHLGRDSEHQVTYYGHPLYYFVGDHKAGKATGEGADHFYAISLSGKAVKPPKKKTPTAPTGPTSAAEVTTGSVGPAMNPKTVLTNSAGLTLYALFTPDEKTSYWCTGGCLSIWRPLLTKASPTSGGSADASELGTVSRSGVGTQVTYNGYPLYTYASDTKAGQNSGESAFGPAYYSQPVQFQYWYELSPAGASD